jgi:hypothetical protein
MVHLMKQADIPVRRRGWNKLLTHKKEKKEAELQSKHNFTLHVKQLHVSAVYCVAIIRLDTET